jgi:hypothetical protein
MQKTINNPHGACNENGRSERNRAWLNPPASIRAIRSAGPEFAGA